MGESFHFDMNGDPPASYDIINWHVTPEGTAEFVQVGHFLSSEGSDDQFHMDMDKVVWGGGSGEEVRTVQFGVCVMMMLIAMIMMMMTNLSSPPSGRSLCLYAVLTVPLVPGMQYRRGSLCAALTVCPVLRERSATQQVVYLGF